MLSDGTNIASAFVASQLDDQVKSGDIADTTIFKVVKYNIQSVPNKPNKMIMVVGVEVLAKTAPTRGDPKPVTAAAVTVKTEVKQEMMSPAPSKAAPVNSPAPGGPSAPTPTNTPPKAPAMTGSPIAMSTGDQNVVPIADINPYMGRWSMKGRIIAKKVLVPHLPTNPSPTPHLSLSLPLHPSMMSRGNPRARTGCSKGAAKDHLPSTS